MPTDHVLSTDTLLLVFGLLLIVTLVLLIVCRAYHFSRELQRINVEIQRSHGLEREHWIREKRRLWLSLLPFVRR